MGSNPSTVYWMDIYLCLKIVKDENKRKRGQGWPISKHISTTFVITPQCDQIWGSLPLWQNFQRSIFEGLLSIWEIRDLLCENLNAIVQIFISEVA